MRSNDSLEGVERRDGRNRSGSEWRDKHDKNRQEG